MSFEINILINKMQRIPVVSIIELIEANKEDFEKLDFDYQRGILNYVEKRGLARQEISDEDIIAMAFILEGAALFSKNPKLKSRGEQELKSMKIDLLTLTEALHDADYNTLYDVITGYHDVLDVKVLETLIVNLPEGLQIKAIKICKSNLMGSEVNSFHNFIASVGKDAQRYILQNFEERFNSYSSDDLNDLPSCLYQDNMIVFTTKYYEKFNRDGNLFYLLHECEEEKLPMIFEQFPEQVERLKPDDLMHYICLHYSDPKKLYEFWCNHIHNIEGVSIPFFKTFIRRIEDEDRFDAIYRFKDKFSEMPLEEIVELFKYDTDEVKVNVLIEYRDRFSGEITSEFSKFMTKDIKEKMIETFIERQKKEFKEKKKQGIDLKEEFASIVSALRDDKRHRLFDDDYIRAITLAQILLFEEKSINDKDPSYIELRRKYMNHLFLNLRRDCTVEDSTNNSMFYRIVKGSVSFNQIDNLETAKALIYLSRNTEPKDVAEVEDLVGVLSEKQVQNYNIKLYKKLCDRIRETYKDSSPLEVNVRKLAFKMFLGFGYDRALRFLESKKSFTTLEFLFNNLRVRNIELNPDGTPVLNKRFMSYLFGNNDKNSNFSKLIHDEIPKFDKYFAFIYNNWNEIFRDLNGSISTKRILDSFKNSADFLKPDEFELEGALNEIDTTEPEIVEKARDWYQIMRERHFSSIPKVKGNMGNYEYEMLDLDDPLALAVGYITRCCFLINGLSRESLYHSISSKNGRTFIVRKDGELIAQSWVWRNGNALCFDNVETRGSYSYDTLLHVYQRASQELLDISNNSENQLESLKVITYGTSESKMSRPKRMFNGALPRVLEKVGYSDAIKEQGILAERKYKKLYYGDVAIRYMDPRPTVREYTNISSMNDEEIKILNMELDAIEFSKTGNVRQTNVRRCKYVACGKDWYIAIDEKGCVTTQILNGDARAIDECKAKADEIKKRIEKKEILVPTEHIGVGGEDR